MKKLQTFTFFSLITSISLLLSCSGDDDGARVIRNGFFPKTITTTSPGGMATIVFNYDTNNRIISFESNDSNVSFEYNEAGLIGQINASDDSENFEVDYNAGIITQFTEINTGDVINVDYSDGIYEFLGGTRSFNEDNLLTSFGDTFSVEYNANPGPFKELDFQPILFFLGGSEVVRRSYFFSPNELSSFAVPLGGQLECTTQRDTDDNIDLVITSDSGGQEIYRFEITYVEREITN